MAYNLSNATNAQNFFEFTVGVDQAVGQGTIWLGILFALGVILFVSQLRFGALRSATSSVLITGFAGIMLILAGAISVKMIAWFVVPMALLSGALFLAWKNQSTE